MGVLQKKGLVPLVSPLDMDVRPLRAGAMAGCPEDNQHTMNGYEDFEEVEEVDGEEGHPGRRLTGRGATRRGKTMPSLGSLFSSAQLHVSSFRAPGAISHSSVSEACDSWAPGGQVVLSNEAGDLRQSGVSLPATWPPPSTSHVHNPLSPPLRLSPSILSATLLWYTSNCL